MMVQDNPIDLTDMHLKLNVTRSHRQVKEYAAAS